MKAVILAGGFGTRLHPLTLDTPKPLMPLLDKPVICYLIQLLKQYSIRDITITLHFLPEKIMAFLGDGSALGVSLHYCMEQEPLGTAGGVRKAFAQADEPILILSADALTDVKLDRAICFHEKRQSKVTILLKKVAMPSEFGIVLCRSGGRIYRFLEKPTVGELFSDLANTGIYILEPEILQMIPENTFYDFSKDLFPKLLDADIPMFGCEIEEYWRDIGNLSAYRQAQFDLLSGSCKSELFSVRTDGCYVSPTARIACNVRLQPPCYIGENAVIAENACLFPYSIVGANASIGSRVILQRAVISAGTQIENGAEVKNAVVGHHATVGSGAAVYDEAVMGNGCQLPAHTILPPGKALWPQSTQPNHGELSPFTPDGICLSSNAPASLLQAVRLGYAITDVAGKGKTVLLAGENTAERTVLKAALVRGGCQCLFTKDVLYAQRMPFLMREWEVDLGVYLEQNGEIFLFHPQTGLLHDTRKLRRAYLDAVPIRQREKPGTDMEIDCGYRQKQAILSLITSLELSKAPHNIGIDGLSQRQKTELTSIFQSVGWKIISADQPNLQRDIDSCFFRLQYDAQHRLRFLHWQGSTYHRHIVQIILAWYLAFLQKKTAVYLPEQIPEQYHAFLLRRHIRIIHSPQPDSWLYEDPAAQCIVLAQLAACGKLMPLLQEVPELFRRSGDVSCSPRQIGSSLRRLCDQFTIRNPLLEKGIHFREGQTWVHIMPGSGGNSLRLRVESMQSEAADEFFSRCTDLIKKSLE